MSCAGRAVAQAPQLREETFLLSEQMASVVQAPAPRRPPSHPYHQAALGVLKCTLMLCREIDEYC